MISLHFQERTQSRSGTETGSDVDDLDAADYQEHGVVDFCSECQSLMTHVDVELGPMDSWFLLILLHPNPG